MEIGGVLVGQGRGARRTITKKGTVIGEVSKKGSRVPAGFGMPASTPEKATEATVLLPAAALKPKRRSEDSPTGGLDGFRGLCTLIIAVYHLLRFRRPGSPDDEQP